MIEVNYQKRKNQELFKGLESSKSLFLSNTQNYIPIYNKFFSLNDTNYNNVNLNHKWYLTNVSESDEENSQLFNCKVKNVTNNKTKEKDVFFKLAPLLDPYKFLIGKYNTDDDKIFKLPQLNYTELDCYEKFIDPNNCAYVDGLFVYLSSNLINTHNFYHGVDYYGSFLSIKNNFTINAFDDIEYLNNSDFFNKNKGLLFKVDDYEYLFQNENQKLKPITIDHNVSAKSQISIKSFDDEIFEDIFDKKLVNLDDLKDMSVDLVDLTNTDLQENKKTVDSITLKSSSSCSSRSSHTDDDEELNCGENNVDKTSNSDSGSDVLEDQDDDDDNDEDDESSLEEERINVVIPKFPVQVICMEYCEDTFDSLILNNDLTKDEWFSALMQIVMILITYQKAFNFTHNDLHTNNVMYNQTDRKFIYYQYKKKYYKVPTFGRIFKIIDFGRSIYKFNGKIFCSDSFQAGGDAATQYNTEPYLNEKKPRLEPNYSFDLCRLACSIFDYVIEDFDEMKDISKCKDPVKRIIVEWCLDDNGVNMLYKNNGQDRYPDFKLYKMIARCVHNHTPQAQLDRPEFDNYSIFKGDIPSDVINIDNIQSYI
jgi:hypothetical protein